MADVTEIRKLLRDGKIVMGADVVLKRIEKGEISEVYVAKNCPEQVLQKLRRYQKVKQFEIEELNINNDQLGVICRKPFFIAVVGVVKG